MFLCSRHHFVAAVMMPVEGRFGCFRKAWRSEDQRCCGALAVLVILLFLVVLMFSELLGAFSWCLFPFTLARPGRSYKLVPGSSWKLVSQAFVGVCKQLLAFLINWVYLRQKKTCSSMICFVN